MPNEYVAVESAFEAIILFFCMHKNVNIDDINHVSKKQLEQLYAASVTYQQNHLEVADKAQRPT